MGLNEIRQCLGRDRSADRKVNKASGERGDFMRSLIFQYCSLEITLEKINFETSIDHSKSGA